MRIKTILQILIDRIRYLAVLRNTWMGGRGRGSSTLAVVLLGELVESDALGSSVDLDEAGDVQLLAGLLHGGAPLGDSSVLLGLSAGLLGDDLAALVHHEARLRETTLGVRPGAVPHLAHGAGLGLFGDLLGLACDTLGCHRLGGFADGFAGSNLDGHDVLLEEEEVKVEVVGDVWLQS